MTLVRHLALLNQKKRINTLSIMFVPEPFQAPLMEEKSELLTQNAYIRASIGTKKVHQMVQLDAVATMVNRVTMEMMTRYVKIPKEI